MTYLAKDIRDHLAGSAALLAAFGPHIYPEVIPQGVTWEQAIIINDVTNEPAYDLSGESGTHTTIIQIDVWTNGKGGKTRAVELAELVRNRLSGYRGQFGSGASGTARIIRNDALAAPPIDGSALFRRRVSQDYEVIHTADIPLLT